MSTAKEICWMCNNLPKPTDAQVGSLCAQHEDLRLRRHEGKVPTGLVENGDLNEGCGEVTVIVDGEGELSADEWNERVKTARAAAHEKVEAAR